MARPQPESWSSRVKTPLMKTIGNRTRVPIIFVVAGRLVGGTEKMLARAAKQSAPKRIATPKITGADMVIPRKRAITISIREIAIP